MIEIRSKAKIAVEWETGILQVDIIVFISSLTVLNAQAKSKAAHNLKSIFHCSTLKTSEN